LNKNLIPTSPNNLFHEQLQAPTFIVAMFCYGKTETEAKCQKNYFHEKLQAPTFIMLWFCCGKTEEEANSIMKTEDISKNCTFYSPILLYLHM
jgi:hypothetical protein